MPEVVICAVARTPVGRYRGALADRSAVELGIHAVKGLLARAEIDPASGIIDEVLLGQVLQTGVGQAPARQVALGAGMPVSTPATTVNKVCGSALKAVMMAANSIRADEYDVIVAGGMESMSNAPYFGHKISRTEFGEMQPTMVHDGLWDRQDIKIFRDSSHPVHATMAWCSPTVTPIGLRYLRSPGSVA